MASPPGKGLRKLFLSLPLVRKESAKDKERRGRRRGCLSNQKQRDSFLYVSNGHCVSRPRMQCKVHSAHLRIF